MSILSLRSLNVNKGPVWWKSQRFILAYLLCSGFCILFFQRTNLSIALICMVNHTARSEVNNHIAFDHDDQSELGYGARDLDDQSARRNIPHDHVTLAGNESHEADGCSGRRSTSQGHDNDGPLFWDKSTEGLLLGALFWTYLLIQIPGGHIMRSLNRKHVIMAAMFVMATMTLLTHQVALWSQWAVFVIRLAMGVCTGFLVIAMYGMWTNWAPPAEKASLISIHVSGQVIGNCLVFPMSAMLCKYGFLGGWPSVFYVHGFLALVWILAFHLLVSDTPASHPTITEEEKVYITTSLPAHTPRTLNPPYLSMLRCPAVYGVCCLGFSFCWGLFLLLSTLPQYMNEVHKLDIKSNGVYSMLPFIAFMLVIQMSGPASDVIIRRKYLSTTRTRKLYVIIGNVTPAALLLWLSSLDCSHTPLVVGLLTLAVGFTGFSQTAYLVNCFDIGQQLTTPMMTMVNSVATVPGIITPYAVAAITVDQSQAQWQTVFFLTSAVWVAGAAGFCLLGSGEVQSWALMPPLEVVVDRLTCQQDILADDLKYQYIPVENPKEQDIREDMHKFQNTIVYNLRCQREGEDEKLV